MPTYRYECASCGYCFDFKQRFSDKPIATCPLCCGVARRLFSPVPIVFKGSGFYITDSRKGKDGGPEAKEMGAKGPELDKGASDH